MANDMLASLAPNIADLGSGWSDLGETPSSADLEQPPAACAPYTKALDTRAATLIHEFSYLDTPQGDESGHVAATLIENPTAPLLSHELSLVRSPNYASCAQATAVAWLRADPGTAIRTATARPVSLGSFPGVIWRVAVDRGVPGHSDVFYLDIGYIAGGNYLAKVRVARCSCTGAQPSPSAEVVPGEQSLLTQLAIRFQIVGTPY